MCEEEKVIENDLKNVDLYGDTYDKKYAKLLDLYNKQKQRIKILEEEREYIKNNLEIDLNRRDVYAQAKGQISQILEYYKNNDKYLKERIKELEEKDELVKYFRGTLPKDTLAIMMCNDDFCRNFGNDFISKDKIKAKIKELEYYKNKFYNNDMTSDLIIKQNQIQVLQQLLEDDKNGRNI